MNDHGEISLIREADTEQKVVIKYDKKCKSIGTKALLSAWGSVTVLQRRFVLHEKILKMSVIVGRRRKGISESNSTDTLCQTAFTV